MGGGITNGIIALSLVFTPAMCRVAETATAQVKNLDFIEAARASGAGTLTIIRYHVLGNVRPRCVSLERTGLRVEVRAPDTIQLFEPVPRSCPVRSARS